MNDDDLKLPVTDDTVVAQTDAYYGDDPTDELDISFLDEGDNSEN